LDVAAGSLSAAPAVGDAAGAFVEGEATETELMEAMDMAANPCLLRGAPPLWR